MSGGSSGRRYSSRNKAIAVLKLSSLFMPERKKVAPTASRMPNSSSGIGKRAAELRSLSSRAIRPASRDCGSRAKVVIGKSSRKGRPPVRQADARGAGRGNGAGCKPDAAADGEGSALDRGQRAAGDLGADAHRHAEPGVGLRVLPGRAGAGRRRGLAIVLAGFGDAETLFGRLLRLDLGGEQQRRAERGSDGERGLHVDLLGI